MTTNFWLQILSRASLLLSFTAYVGNFGFWTGHELMELDACPGFYPISCGLSPGIGSSPLIHSTRVDTSMLSVNSKWDKIRESVFCELLSLNQKIQNQILGGQHIKIFSQNFRNWKKWTHRNLCLHLVLLNVNIDFSGDFYKGGSLFKKNVKAVVRLHPRRQQKYPMVSSGTLTGSSTVLLYNC